MKSLLKVLLAFGLVVTGLYGCDSGKNNAFDKEVAQNALDLSGRDTTVSPADNFFEYANGTWLENTEIPSSKTGWGSFYIVRDSALYKMKAVMDSLVQKDDLQEGSIEQQVAGLYKSIMDSVTIEEAGLEPIAESLDRIEGINSSDDIFPEIVREYKNGKGPLFSFYVGSDDKNSSIERVHLDQGGLGLPNKEYYLKEDDRSKDIRSAYEDYIATIMALSGSDKAEASGQARKIIDFETELAKASKTPVELRDPEANYHLMTVSELDEISSNPDWPQVIEQMDLGVDTVQVGQPDFYKKVSALIESAPLDVWKNYLRFHLVSSYAPWLSSPFAEAHFDFFNKTLNGQQQSEPRWKRASNLVNRQLGDALGQLYVERYFPPEAKEYMAGMVNNLEETYRERIKRLDWMSDSTKDKAVSKLDAFVNKIGYPDEWKDYSSVDIDSSSLIANLRQTGQWQYQHMVDKLGEPVDRTEWFMTAPTVNAYYNPSFNEIVFPAGILQPPFYHQGADDAVNYGAIGAVIGHEMTHGFDDQGSQYDELGNLKNWWTENDRKRFEKLTQQVVEEYNNYTVLDSLHINGQLTLGENIADIGGLAIAFEAFEKTEQAKEGEKINGLTPEQRFFLSFAQVWRIKNTPKRLRFRINNDPHSPEEFRVKGPTSNMEAFYKAFDVEPGDGMYRPDSLRISIW